MAVLKYKENGQWVKIPIFGKAQVEAVQVTGNSENEVMSQKAVTLELNKKANIEDIYSKTETEQRIQDIIGTAPEALDTLGEIADRLSQDNDAITAINGVLDGKADSIHTHEISSITGLQTILDNKASTDIVSSDNNGLMSFTDKEYLDYLNGCNISSSISNVPINKHMFVATLSSNGSLSIADTLQAGRELHIIVKNTSASDIIITIPDSFVKFEDSLTVSAGSYADINILSDGTNMYLRAL